MHYYNFRLEKKNNNWRNYHMKQIIQDERYQVTEHAIQDAFFLCIQEQPMDKITVSKIIKKAGIVRSTFYNHYESVPALISSLEEQTLQKLFTILETFQPKNDYEICKSFYLTICNYTMHNPFLAELLRSPQGDQFLEKALTMFHQYVSKITQTTSPKSCSKEVFSYVIASSIGSSLGILHKWSRSNFELPADTVATILTKTFLATFRPFLS